MCRDRQSLVLCKIGGNRLRMSAFGTKRTFHDRVPMSAFGGKADIQRIQSMPSFRACQTSTLRLDADAVFRWADTRPRIAEQAAGRGSLVASPQAASRL